MGFEPHFPHENCCEADGTPHIDIDQTQQNPSRWLFQTPSSPGVLVLWQPLQPRRAVLPALWHPTRLAAGWGRRSLAR